MSLITFQNQNNYSEYEYIHKALKNNTDINLTNTQIENLHKKIQDIQKLPDSFYNMKKVEDSDLSNYKFHFFKNEKSINIYMHQRGQSYPRAGFAKQFSIAHCFIITNEQPGSNLSCSLFKVAYLRLNFNNQRKFDEIREKFKEEIKILEKLKGKDHICQIRDAKTYSGFHDKKPIEKVVMYQDLYKSDYHDYFTEQLVTNSKKLTSLPTRKNFIHGILKALSHLREINLIHNDITLSNIFLDEQENVFLGDFGFAEDFSYKSHFLNGDTRYFSPEKFERITTPQNAEKIDIWAAGCAFLKLYTLNEIPWACFLYMHKKLSYLKNFYHEKNESLHVKKADLVIDETILKSTTPKFYSHILAVRSHIKNTKQFLNYIKTKNSEPFQQLFLNSEQLTKEIKYADEICEHITNIIKLINTPISSSAIESEKNFNDSHPQMLLSFLLREIEPLLSEIETIQVILKQIWINLGTYLNIQRTYPYPPDLNLVLRMLEPDPEKRISLDEALKFTDK